MEDNLRPNTLAGPTAIAEIFFSGFRSVTLPGTAESHSRTDASAERLASVLTKT